MTVVTDGAGVRRIYAHGDIVLIVRAVDPALTGVFSALP